MEKDVLNVVIVYSTSSSPTLISYAPPNVVTRDQVQEMIGQAIDTFVEHQCQENEQFGHSMQNTITTQFSNLGLLLLQNLQQAKMFILGVVVALGIQQPPTIVQPPPLTNQQPPIIEPPPPTSVVAPIELTPPPPPVESTSPPPSSSPPPT
ncbi:hypothetical protein JHK82_012297 [Glycine max]|uniref:Uncharacterized protein n=1 Tax=Glycine soja TaxID=3848 RepID=A0A0B2RF56_GLYSO|nr:hypothetical protein JHK85_012651 [Glycine max]KAG5057311.1 hypothetical protein JHK86_012307 [Glycine max]KAG5154328.1 hypothetical protein JHK82_012297 [Glycine max]KHN30979.1 hypothetical protein glysoja_048677 [Glycine soja]